MIDLRSLLIPNTKTTKTTVVRSAASSFLLQSDVKVSSTSIFDIGQRQVQQNGVEQNGVEQNVVQQNVVQQNVVQQSDVQQNKVRQNGVEQNGVEQKIVRQRKVRQKEIQQPEVQQPEVQQQEVQQNGVQQNIVQQTEVQQTEVQKRDPYFGFVLNKDSVIEIYKAIYEKGYTCHSPYINSSEKMKLECRGGHTFNWYSPRALIPVDNCVKCWRFKSISLAERLRQIVTARNGIQVTPYVTAKLKISFKCHLKHTFETTYNNIMEGSWCSECLKPSAEKAKLKLLAIISEKGGKLLSPYINSNTKVDIECKNKHVFHPLAKSISRKKSTWCPVCFGKSPIEAKLKFEKTVASKQGTLLSPYIKSGDKVKIRCVKGHIFLSRPHKINAGTWCKKCANLCPEQARERFMAIVEARGGIVVGEYVKSYQKVTIICELNHRFEKIPSNVITCGTWCRKCSNTCPIQAKENFELLINKRNATMVGTYINCKTKVHIKCENNHDFYIAHCNTAKGSWCPSCGKNGSEGERRIRHHLTNFNIKFREQVTCDWLPRSKYDFLIIHNNKTFLLEFDGRQHFKHIEFFHPTPEIYEGKRQIDVLKTAEALNHGHHFIRIAHTDMLDIGEIIDEIINDPTPSKLTFSDESMYEWITDGLKKDFNIDHLTI